MRRLALILFVALLLVASLGLFAGASQAHSNPCHQDHSCPSDHHTYLWRGLSCTSYADERLAADTKAVTYAGRTYWCHGSTTAPNSGTSSPSAVGASVPLGRRTQTSGCTIGQSHGHAVLPDPECSPGAIDPHITQKNVRSTICVSGYTKSVRDVSESKKDDVYREYGRSTHAPRSYEIDHIVSLELGGSNGIANLYPEAYTGPYGARRKDVLENFLHRQVCSGRLKLQTAQRLIAHDWLASYFHYRLG